MKAQLKIGTTILSVILASDKTHLTNFTGDKSMHAVYMSLGNIRKDVRKKLSAHAGLLVAKIPIPKFPCTNFSGSKTERAAMPGILCQRLFHHCMKIALQPTHLDTRQYHIVPGPDGQLWLTMAVMMAWIADLEEQIMIAGVNNKSCPVCLGMHKNFDSWNGPTAHTSRTPNDTINELRLVRQLHPEASLYEFKQEVMKHQSGLSGAVEELCWEGLPVGPNVFIVQDLLHGCYKFVWDHVAEWLKHSIGEEELDRHFRAQPNLGFRGFSDGISKISQATGCEHRSFIRFIVSVIAGYQDLEPRALIAVRSLMDYIFMAHNPLNSVSDLKTMAKYLSDFHKNKNIFIENGSRGEMNHLRIPKLHTLLHYLENTYQLGVPDNFSTETPESLRCVRNHIRLQTTATSMFKY